MTGTMTRTLSNGVGLAVVAAAAVALLLIPARPQAQPGQRGAAPAGARPRAAARTSTTPRCTCLPVQGNVYMLVGAGGNVTIQVGDEGVLLVDTSLARS